MSPPILGFPLESGGSFLIDTDASGYAIGAVISQFQESKECVIAYGSHTLSAAEQNYCATKKELHSVVYFLQHYKQYLLGRRFIRGPSGILARWMSILGAYDYEVIYRPGPSCSKHR